MADALNAAQQSAVEAWEGPVLIIAGPGTGKTKTLTARIRYLTEQADVAPERILALTFTKKAAEEMRLRVGPDGKQSAIMTFHALCYALLGGELQFVSEPKRLQLIKALPRPKELKTLSVRELGLRISRAKNMADDDPAIRKVVAAYNKSLEQHGLADFDDVLVRVKAMLEADAVRRSELQARYDFILIDEFQDTNRLQYEILKLLLGDSTNLFVIGDPEQSIYGFRGASGDIFDQFKADFPAHAQIALMVNYRSAPAIVRLSNAIAAAAPKLTAHASNDGVVRAVRVLNEYSEAAWVVNEIQQAIGGGDFRTAVSDDERANHCTLRDFAVIYRSRSAALAVQKAMADSGLPYRVVGDGSPYDTPELQALLALLEGALTGARPPLEGFSAAEQKAVYALLGETDQAVPSIIGQKLVRILGLEVTPDVQQFLQVLVGRRDLATAVAYFNAIAEQGFYDPAADAVTLLTIHASKGLEFTRVFLVGAEDGILPHARADEAEERRLFYVAATRAKHHLDMLYTSTRAGAPAELSRFVKTLPRTVVPLVTDPHLARDLQRTRKRTLKRSQQRLF